MGTCLSKGAPLLTNDGAEFDVVAKNEPQAAPKNMEPMFKKREVKDEPREKKREVKDEPKNKKRAVKDEPPSSESSAMETSRAIRRAKSTKRAAMPDTEAA